MSLWVLVPISFIHITVGGAIGFWLLFLGCADRGVTVSKLTNDICVALWFAYSASLVLSVVLIAYFYLTGSQSSYYWWYAMPWIFLVVLIVYWRVSTFKLA
ncbi:hypothetical protein [Vibrio tapetis]|uniref:Vco30 n=1 Tax=Vibrio tapetis subsp. tapetis TaxID=1671868 RepID=A0A2N8Z967_9VIBR|nr:hypothetical protein [Vibrio tapetis]SON48458.1 Vco30 [Vibrio tapetis subsp. tapetis]